MKNEVNVAQKVYRTDLSLDDTTKCVVVKLFKDKELYHIAYVLGSNEDYQCSNSIKLSFEFCSIYSNIWRTWT